MGNTLGYRRRFSVFFNNKGKWSINLKNVVLHLIVLIPLKYQSTKYIKIINNKYTLENYALSICISSLLIVRLNVWNPNAGFLVLLFVWM